MMAICKNVIFQAKGASKRKFLIAQSRIPVTSPICPWPVQGVLPSIYSMDKNTTHFLVALSPRLALESLEGSIVPCNVEWTPAIPLHSLLLIAVTHNYGVRLGRELLEPTSKPANQQPPTTDRSGATHPAAGCSIFACLLCCFAILISLFGLPSCLLSYLFFLLHYFKWPRPSVPRPQPASS